MSWFSKKVKKVRKAVKKVIPSEVRDVVDDVVEGSKQIGEAIGYGGKVESKRTKRIRRDALARLESAERRARGPSLDEAQRNQAESDRIRRRRGVLANIYAGGSASQPNVGTKQLLGS